MLPARATRKPTSACPGPPPGEDCDDKAGGEGIRSRGARTPDSGLLEPDEGVREDAPFAESRQGVLLRRRPAVHVRHDSHGPGPEQDDQGHGPPVAADEQLQRPRPARVRHARAADRGPGREDLGDHEQEGNRGARDRTIREHVQGVRARPAEEDAGPVRPSRRVDGLGPSLHHDYERVHRVGMVDDSEGPRAGPPL